MSLLTNEYFDSSLSGWTQTQFTYGAINFTSPWEWTNEFGGSAQGANKFNTKKQRALGQAYAFSTSQAYRVTCIARVAHRCPPGDENLYTVKEIYFTRTFWPSQAWGNIAFTCYFDGADYRFLVFLHDDITHPAQRELLLTDITDGKVDGDPGACAPGIGDFNVELQVTSFELEFFTPAEQDNQFTPGLEVSPGAPYTFYNPTDTMYQDEAACGVKFPCFEQIMNCSDLLTLNIKFGPTFEDSFPQLRIKNKLDDSLITTVNFTNIVNDELSPGDNTNYWIVEYNPAETSPNPICGKSIYLEIWEVALSPSIEVLRKTSEPICVRESHPCSIIIKYRNQNDAFNMGYSQQSPQYQNWLRVRAIIRTFEATYPQQKDQYRKSDGTLVKLRANIEKQVPLEIDFVPNFMHEKLIHVLEHSDIEINDVSYVNENPYEFEPNRRYALSKGSATLTAKNYYKESLI